MNDILICSIACSPAMSFATSFLSKAGIPFTDHPTPDATHLLLDVPSHNTELSSILPSLPNNIAIIGGNLSEEIRRTYKHYDMLSDENYLARNAAITSECALSVLMQNSKHTVQGSNVLIIGWGRIGKHLACLLSRNYANLSILSRTPKHCAEASSFGFNAFIPDQIQSFPLHFDFIINTAPCVLLPDSFYTNQQKAVKIDLASSPGIACADVIRARGLPGRMVPESSGELIARTVLRWLQEEAL